MGEYSFPLAGLDASGLRVAIVVSRFNEDITGALLDGATRALQEHGLAADALSVESVPGAYELPLVAKQLAAVVRGDTPHFDYVAGEAARGIMQASLDTGVPVIFGVLTVDTRQQALDRVGGSEGHKGEEAAITAIEMANLVRRLSGGSHRA